MSGLSTFFQPGHRTRIMAVINASPESFYGGSVAKGLDAVAIAAKAAKDNGASLLDIGAMSTAPYKETQISEGEEISRMRDAVQAARESCDLLISADTQRAAVASAAIEAGAAIINDVSAFAADPKMGEVCAEAKGVVLMANDSPGLQDQGESPAQIVCRLMEAALKRAEKAGIDRQRIILDPGFGFFRHRSLSWDQFDLEMLRGIETYRQFHRPLLLGVSRKSFFKKALGRDQPEERLAGSLAVAQWAIQKRVEWLRVHDVAETSDVLRMMELLAIY